MRPSTKEIVIAYSHSIKTVMPDLIFSGCFDDWLKLVSDFETEIANDLDEKYHEFLPLRTEVMKLVVKELYGHMPYSKEYILRTYGQSRSGIKYVYFPSSGNKRLIVSFSGFIKYISFARLSWYFDSSEEWDGDTSYLFLGDPDCYWYVGKEESPTATIYEQIIISTMRNNGFSADKVFCVGASMGGYAALYFSIKLKLHSCFSIHAQLNKRSARLYELDNWDKNIRECGRNFYDVVDLVDSSSTLPNIYLEVGRHPSDRCGVDELFRSINKHSGVFVISNHQDLNHNTPNPTKETIAKYIELFEFYGTNHS